MAHKSPTSLNTSRNIALQKGVAPAKLAEPVTTFTAPIVHSPPEKCSTALDDVVTVPSKRPFAG